MIRLKRFRHALSWAAIMPTATALVLVAFPSAVHAQPGGMEGSIRWHDGRPFVGGSVAVTGSVAGASWKVRQTTIDSTGHFQLDSLDTGRLRVEVKCAGPLSNPLVPVVHREWLTVGAGKLRTIELRLPARTSCDFPQYQERRVRVSGTHSFGFEENYFWPCPRQADLSDFELVFEHRKPPIAVAAQRVWLAPGLSTEAREERGVRMRFIEVAGVLRGPGSYAPGTLYELKIDSIFSSQATDACP